MVNMPFINQIILWYNAWWSYYLKWTKKAYWASVWSSIQRVTINTIRSLMWFNWRIDKQIDYDKQIAHSTYINCMRSHREISDQRYLYSVFLTGTLIAFVLHRWEHLILPVCSTADASLRGLSASRMPTCQAISNQNTCRK